MFKPKVTKSLHSLLPKEFRLFWTPLPPSFFPTRSWCWRPLALQQNVFEPMLCKELNPMKMARKQTIDLQFTKFFSKEHGPSDTFLRLGPAKIQLKRRQMSGPVKNLYNLIHELVIFREAIPCLVSKITLDSEKRNQNDRTERVPHIAIF